MSVFAEKIDGGRIRVRNRAALEGHATGALEVTFLSYGCIIQSLKVSNKCGELTNVALGFEDAEEYHKSYNPYFGAIIGRYANRIAKGEFEIDGKTHSVDKNEKEKQTLHGGVKGWDKFDWEAAIEDSECKTTVKFTRTSPAGEMGFPGEVKATVFYCIPKDRQELTYTVDATTSEPTVINMTNHCYFNLRGHNRGTIEDTKAQIFADKFVPVDADCCPTGSLKCVEGTAFDFRKPRMFSEHINSPVDEDIKIGAGYDHSYLFKLTPEKESRHVASFSNCCSGIRMDVWTNCPCAQLYTGNWIDVPNRYGRRAGFAFETGNAASAMHHSGVLPNCVLRPGETYHHSTSFRFMTCM